MFGGRDIGGQRAFIKKHAGNYVPAHKDMYIVLVPQPVSTTDVDAPLRQSQIEAAKRGCDLVLVYRTEIRSSTHTNQEAPKSLFPDKPNLFANTDFAG
jgi:hypothetical protein